MVHATFEPRLVTVHEPVKVLMEQSERTTTHGLGLGVATIRMVVVVVPTVVVVTDGLCTTGRWTGVVT